MSNDDRFPTSSWSSTPKWMNGSSGESFNLIFRPGRSSSGDFNDPLLPDPMVYLCPSKKGISPAQPNISLNGHVSYNWCDGLTNDLFGERVTIACDGADNHSDGTGRCLQSDGSIGVAEGTSSIKWTQTSAFKFSCYGNNPPNYSFH